MLSKKYIKNNCISVILYTLNISVLSNLLENYSQLMHILRGKCLKLG